MTANRTPNPIKEPPGPVVQWEDAASAGRKSGFNSRLVHYTPMVKRKSSLASNETLRVRLLLGVLLVADGVCSVLVLHATL